MRVVQRLTVLFCALLLCCPLSACSSGTLLAYDEFGVYRQGELLAFAPEAVSAPGRYDGFAGYIGQTFAPGGEALSTLRGVGIGTTLEDFERYYGDVSFSLVQPQQGAARPLGQLLRDIDPYGEITLQTRNYFSFQNGTPQPIDEETFLQAESWGENVQLIRMNFVLDEGSVQDVQLFVKARL